MRNSGVFLQGRYEIQILDSFGNEPPTNVDYGRALYQEIAPSKNACKKPEEWQSYDITFHAPHADKEGAVTPGRLTVVHNGQTVIDNAPFQQLSPVAVDPSVNEPGPIRLQDHHAAVRFRNLRLTPLTPAGPGAAATPAAGYEVNFFNGQDWTGLQQTADGKPEHWKIENDNLIMLGDPAGGWLMTEADYKDFEVRLEYKMGKKGNSGAAARPAGRRPGVCRHGNPDPRRRQLSGLAAGPVHREHLRRRRAEKEGQQAAGRMEPHAHHRARPHRESRVERRTRS